MYLARGVYLVPGSVPGGGPGLGVYLVPGGVPGPRGVPGPGGCVPGPGGYLPRSGWPRHRENRENREFGSYFFQTGKTQGILF